jgi:hypothetical protein
MTREEYEIAREPLVTALAEFDANNPPPPDRFDVVSAAPNTSNPSETGIDLAWGESVDTTEYRIDYLDTSLNPLGGENVTATSKTNAGSGIFTEADGYVRVTAISPGGERLWDAGDLRFPT